MSTRTWDKPTAHHLWVATVGDVWYGYDGDGWFPLDSIAVELWQLPNPRDVEEREPIRARRLWGDA